MADYDAIVVGAGFGGLYALKRLRDLGLRVRLYEAGSGVGGVWFWNRYPGARCDVEALDYSYSFSEELQQEWEWSERYPAQPEIQRYLEHVVERFGLGEDIQFDTRVVSAVWDDEARSWTVTTDDGGVASAPFCVMATGVLSAIQPPDIDGLDTFAGELYFTAAWPAEPVEFAGKRVGVIGTGSSGVQVIPEIAKEAEHLYVFQRTPNHSVPAHNHPMDPAVTRELKAAYAERRAKSWNSYFGIPLEPNPQATMDVAPEERQRIYQERWDLGGFNFLLSFGDIAVNKEANASAAEFIRAKIRATVEDPTTAELLLPGDHPVGTKRICVDTGYYETFNRANVTLVDARSAPIEAVTPTGIRAGGEEIALDMLVCATGFDAMTGALARVDIRGRGGLTLKEHWARGPRTYLGLATSAFPNMFFIAGAGSPSVLSNMVLSCQQHGDWIAECVQYLREHELATIEPAVDAEEAWGAEVNTIADGTVYREANSWYTGSNVPGKPRVFTTYLGGMNTYVRICNEVVEDGYRGFVLDPVSH